MFRKGIHKAIIRHTKKPHTNIDCMLEYHNRGYIFFYSNDPAFCGDHSEAFKNNSYGYRYCYWPDPDFIIDLVYQDTTYFIGEL